MSSCINSHCWNSDENTRIVDTFLLKGVKKGCDCDICKQNVTKQRHSSGSGSSSNGKIEIFFLDKVNN